MTFRKNAIEFHQRYTYCLILIILNISLIPTLGLVLSILFAAPFLGLALMSSKIESEFITINENGISCTNTEKKLWEYQWEEIAELRKSSRFRSPSVEVIIYSRNREPEDYALPNQYFQLSKSAKEALSCYAPSEKLHYNNQ